VHRYYVQPKHISTPRKILRKLRMTPGMETAFQTQLLPKTVIQMEFRIPDHPPARTPAPTSKPGQSFLKAFSRPQPEDTLAYLISSLASFEG